jgi:hypothetical protein
MRNSSRVPAGTAVTRPENHDRMPLPDAATAQQAGGSNRTHSAIMGRPGRNSMSYRVPAPTGPPVIFATRRIAGFHSISWV